MASDASRLLGTIAGVALSYAIAGYVLGQRIGLRQVAAERAVTDAAIVELQRCIERDLDNGRYR
jgi:hypothetical protein